MPVHPEAFQQISTPAAELSRRNSIPKRSCHCHTLSAARFIGRLVWSAVCSTALQSNHDLFCPAVSDVPGLYGKTEGIDRNRVADSVLVLPTKNLLLRPIFPGVNGNCGIRLPRHRDTASSGIVAEREILVIVMNSLSVGGLRFVKSKPLSRMIVPRCCQL